MAFAPLAVKRETAGDVRSVIEDSDGTAADVTATNVAAGNGLQTLPAKAETTAPALTTGTAAFLSLTTGGLLRSTLEGAPAVSGTVTANAGTGPAEASGWFTRLTDGVGGPVAVQNDNAAVPGAGLETLAAVAETTAATRTSGNLALLSLQTNGALRVASTVAAPSTPTLNTATAAAVAPAATSTLESADPGTTGTAKLRKLILSATTQAKWEIKTKSNAVVSGVLATLFTSPVAPPAEFAPPTEDFTTVTLSVGADSFQVIFTNLEPAGGKNADVAANFFWNL